MELSVDDVKTIAMIPDPTMDSIKIIVEFLNSDPISQDIDVAQLLIKSPEELLSLLNHVCLQIDSTLDL